MEDKKLDFSQPFLSVRRFASSPAASGVDSKRKPDRCIPSVPPIPYYKSELNSGPIRNPGTVPFTWERTPGRPKHENKALWPPSAPRLPPGRALNGNESTSKPLIKNVISYVNEIDSSSEEMEEEGSSDSRDSEEAYLDAVDTLSRTESLFLNCSLSGVSGVDGPDLNQPAALDSQARDLMLSRFLPAAKAMISESPQYAYRKRPVAREKEREEIKAVGNGETYNLPRYDPYQGGEEDSEEEGEDAKACGLFSRFCFTKSVFPLNPVPRMRVQAPASSVRRMKARPPSDSSHEKAQTTFHELLAIPVVEKTLYIDSVYKEEPRNSNSNASDMKELTEVEGNDPKTLIRSQAVEENPLIKSSLGDDKGSNIVCEKQVLKQNDTLQCVHSSLTKKSSEVLMHMKKDSQIPLNPPLPKSPSESWLWRTLPSFSSKDRSSLSYRSYQNKPRVWGTKTATSVDPKWETIVKTSHNHHEHSQFPELE